MDVPGRLVGHPRVVVEGQDAPRLSGSVGRERRGEWVERKHSSSHTLSEVTAGAFFIRSTPDLLWSRPLQCNSAATVTAGARPLEAPRVGAATGTFRPPMRGERVQVRAPQAVLED